MYPPLPLICIIRLGQVSVSYYGHGLKVISWSTTPTRRVVGTSGSPNWRDLAAVLLVLGHRGLLGVGARWAVRCRAPADDLAAALPFYTLRTGGAPDARGARRLAGLHLHLRHAGRPKSRQAIVLDVLQSVPILGCLSFTVVFFVSSCFPATCWSRACRRLAARAKPGTWRSLSTSRSGPSRPISMRRAAASGSRPGSTFWRLDVPFAMPGWNMMMSMSGGWFFVVHLRSGCSSATCRSRFPASAGMSSRDSTWPFSAMTIAIVVGFSVPAAGGLGRQVSVRADGGPHRSEKLVLALFRRSTVARGLNEPISCTPSRRGPGSFSPSSIITQFAGRRPVASSISSGTACSAVAGLAYVAWELLRYGGATLSWDDLSPHRQRRFDAAAGRHPDCARFVDTGFRSAWPSGCGRSSRRSSSRSPSFRRPFRQQADLLIVRFDLAPKICVTPTGHDAVGTQWYIISSSPSGAGARSQATSGEAAASLRVRPWHWWRDVVLRGNLPLYVTGAIPGGCLEREHCFGGCQLGSGAPAERIGIGRPMRADDGGWVPLA